MAKKNIDNNYYEVEYYAYIGEHGHAGSYPTYETALKIAKDLYEREEKDKDGSLKELSYIGISGDGDEFAVIYISDDYIKSISEKDFKSKESYDNWIAVAQEVLKTKKTVKGNYGSGIIKANGGGVNEGVKKKNLKKGDTIQILARRWFERTNGNTYHSVDVHVNNEFVGREDFTYGYGDHYKQTAKKLLSEKYNFPKGFDEKSALWHLRDSGITILDNVTDVSGKKDLAKGGSIGSSDFASYYADHGAIMTCGSYFNDDTKACGGYMGKGGSTNGKTENQRLENRVKNMRKALNNYKSIISKFEKGNSNTIDGKFYSPNDLRYIESQIPIFEEEIAEANEKIQELNKRK